MAVEVTTMRFCWCDAVDADKHVMVRGEVTGVFKSNRRKETPVRTKDIVTTGGVATAESCLCPGVTAMVPTALWEMG